jgi:Leucine-rich repeat (LRR) protein
VRLSQTGLTTALGLADVLRSWRPRGLAAVKDKIRLMGEDLEVPKSQVGGHDGPPLHYWNVALPTSLPTCQVRMTTHRLAVLHTKIPDLKISQIRWLDLSGNHLETCAGLTDFPSLVVLNLTGNRLSAVREVLKLSKIGR